MREITKYHDTSKDSQRTCQEQIIWCSVQPYSAIILLLILSDWYKDPSLLQHIWEITVPIERSDVPSLPLLQRFIFLMKRGIRRLR